MKRKSIFYSFLIWCAISASAQQAPAYTQYLFNKAGLNPAASGTDMNQKYVYVTGINRQWYDVDYAPKLTFVNFSYTIRPPRAYRFWQNAGVYIESDQSGLMGSTSIYGSYTLHYLIRKKLVASFGVYAGVRRFTRSVGSFDPNDPAVQRNKYSLLLYPDIMPGFRLSAKKFFLDLSFRQLTVFKLQDFKGRRIGSPSKLQPSVYFDYGHKIPLMDNLLMIPSFATTIPLIGPPNVDASVMFFYATRVGAGLGIRNLSFGSAILQVRFLENMTVGFAYSYPINSMRYASSNSFEIMVGVKPMGLNSKTIGGHSVAKCPTLDF